MKCFEMMFKYHEMLWSFLVISNLTYDSSCYANIPKLSKGLLKRADFLYMCLAIASPLASQKGVNIIFLISNFHHCWL